MLWRIDGFQKRGAVSLEGILTFPSVRTGIVCVWAWYCTRIGQNTPKIHPNISQQPPVGSINPSDPRPSPFDADYNAHLRCIIAHGVVWDRDTLVISWNGSLLVLKNTLVRNEPRQSKMTPLDSHSLQQPDSTLNHADPSCSCRDMHPQPGGLRSSKAAKINFF